MTFSTLAPTDSLLQVPCIMRHALRRLPTKRTCHGDRCHRLGHRLGVPEMSHQDLAPKSLSFRCRSTDLFNVVHGSTVHRRGEGALRHLGGCGCGHHLLARGAPLGSDMCFHYVKKLGLAMDSPNFWLF